MEASQMVSSILLLVGCWLCARGAWKQLSGGHPWQLFVGCHLRWSKGDPSNHSSSATAFSGRRWTASNNLQAVVPLRRPFGSGAAGSRCLTPSGSSPAVMRLAVPFSIVAVVLEPDPIAFPNVVLGPLVQIVRTCLKTCQTLSKILVPPNLIINNHQNMIKGINTLLASHRGDQQ